jgi:chromosome segregation protein
MHSRSERIAALEAQLANSRRRRSQLLGSLGKESGGAGDAEYAEPHSPLSPLDREPARGLARSDLSASPGMGDSLGYGWTPVGRQDAGLKSSPPAGSASGGDDALRAELKQRTRQVSELQAKLAEATRKTEQAVHQALEDKAAFAQLASQKAQLDRRIEVLEGAVAEEKRSAESCQGRIAELRQHGSVHEEAARKLRAELHQKTLDFDRIRDESRRQHSEELQRAKDGLMQSKAEIDELKSALSASQKKEGDLSQQLQTQEAALKELQNKEQSQVESLRQSKIQSSEQELRLEQTKSDLQLKIDKMQQQITLLSASNDDLRQKEQSLFESLRQCKKQNHEFQLKIDRLQMDTSVLGSATSGLEKQLDEAGVLLLLRLQSASLEVRLTLMILLAERDAEQLRSKLHRAQLQLDSDETVIATLRADLSTLAGLDESLKAAATAETARSNDLQ